MNEQLRIVTEHGPWTEVPGERVEGIGWTLPDRMPLLPGQKLWNGSSFKGAWVNTQGIVHLR